MASQLMRLFGFGAKPANSRSKAALRRIRGSFEQLETRQLMYGASIDTSRLGALVLEHAAPAAYVSTAAIIAGNCQGPSAGGSVSSLGAGSNLAGSTVNLSSAQLSIKPADPRTLDQQMGLPFLDSLPGAAATLYLDFNGNFESDWWHYDNGKKVHFSNVTTPVFDTDGNPNSFGADEQNLIKNIWSRVAEDYAPFKINVSTDYYGSFNNGQALHVAVGGNNTDWLKTDASGISSIGSFSDTAPNVVFAFDLVAWAKAGVKDGDGQLLDGAAATATTISHEAGHAFGLFHRALYKVDGTKITDYNPGVLGWTPIMGDNKASDRTTWNAGTTDQGANTWQTDMDVIARPANGFGYRADDHGNSIATADALLTSINAASLTGKGLINNTGDWDVFKFTSTSSQFQVTVNAAKFGPNLIPIAELWSSSGLVARADAGSLTQSIIHANVAAGTYFVVVKSLGDYGDVGQYTVSVSFSPTLTTSTGSTTTPTTTGLVSSPLTAAATSVQDSQPVTTTSVTTVTTGSASLAPAKTPRSPTCRPTKTLSCRPRPAVSKPPTARRSPNCTTIFSATTNS